MVGCFGLRDDNHPSHFPGDLVVEANPRLDVFWLNRIGALVEGAKTQVKLADGRCLRLARKAGILEIAGHPVSVVHDQPMPGVDRVWFFCPVCKKRRRFIFLRDVIACRGCLGLRHAVRHLRRQTPGVGRVERLRRKLGGCDIRPFAPLPALRRGRSRAYHDKLVAQILDEEAKLIGHLQTVTHDLERRIRIRKARGEW